MKYAYRTLSAVHRIAAGGVRGVAAGARWLLAFVPLPTKLCFGFLLLAAMGVVIWRGLPDFVDRAAEHVRLSPELAEQLEREGVPDGVQRLAVAAGIVAGACGWAALLAWIPRGWALFAQRIAAAVFAALWVWLFWLATSVPALLHDFDYRLYSKETRNEHWISLGVPLLLAAIPPLVMLVAVWLRTTRRAYTRTAPAGASWADRVADALRTDGGDTRFRSSVGWSILLFLLVLLVPLLTHLLRNLGEEEPYGLIKGRGEPAVQVVVKMKKRPPKQKKLIVNRWSPFILQQPKLSDVTTADDLDRRTSDQYKAQVGKGGNLGRGGKGPGGWPQGLVDGKIRFIRLKYAGGDWDQDMGKGADYNLLLRFREVTGFKIADDTEHIEIPRLRHFPEKRSPPFVFLTGKGGIDLSAEEVKTLRWYCIEEGGCLFIDNGGGVFHTAVVRALRRVFPEKSLSRIAFDDPIFEAPYRFPNGAPPLWHHAGERALGIRDAGRWVVFYHPGDVNDAWKSGHSGADAAVAEQAYRLGINVMYYTFNQYYRIHFEE